MKKEKKGSLFDVFVISFLLLSILGASLRWQQLSASPSEERFVECILLTRATGLHTDTALCIAEGDELYTAAGEYYGRITAKEVRALGVRLVEDGALFEGVWEDTWCDVRLGISVRGIQQGDAFLKGGRERLLGGQSLTLYTQRAALALEILDFSVGSA